MFACICRVVSVDEVHSAIDRGAQTVAALGEATGAGTSCGSCHDHLDDLIADRCGSCPLVALAS